MTKDRENWVVCAIEHALEFKAPSGRECVRQADAFLERHGQEPMLQFELDRAMSIIMGE